MKIKKTEGGSAFRKIAMGSWQTAADPTVYGLLEIDMTNALAYLEKVNQKSDVKIGVTELIGRATALVLKKRPEMNGLIKWSRIYLRESVNLFFQVNVAHVSDPVGKANLLGVTVDRAEHKSIQQIAKELKEKSSQVRAGVENDIARSSRILSKVPWSLMRYVLNFSSFLNYELDLPLKAFGMPKDPFGSVMITNVGSMGVETAWAPLVPYTRVPLLLTLGAVKPRPWVVSGQIEVRPIMRIGCTFDHRFMDGVHAAAMQKLFTEYLEQPELME